MAYGPVGRNTDKPEMKDVGTDTILIPNWWVSEQERRKKESARRRSAKECTRCPPALATHTNTGADSAIEMDVEGWREVVGRKPAAAPLSGLVVRQPIPLRTGMKPGATPPAILVKVAAASSYADTVRAVRQNSELNIVDLGAQVTVMRKARDGHLLVELAKGAVLAAHKLS